MSATLSSLPPELYSAIINQVPPAHVQQVAFALSRALPRSPIPQSHIFEFIYIRHAPQVFRLYRRLRASPIEASWVKEFSLEIWTVDAQLVVNLLKLLKRIHRLSVFIGPNFAPEHMEEMLDLPYIDLKFINLRFRPYVQRATYYQFLKGAYFDSTLLALSRWPASTIPSISIIQDPLDSAVAARQTFAQPLVFFRLDSLTTLVRSRFTRQLSAFRLRIPARQAARFVCALPGTLPALALLDLSTCNILASEVEPLVARFPHLRHLVLDGCSVIRGELREADWAELGRSCALGGARRARERERKLKAWLEANAARAMPPDAAQQGAGEPGTQLAERRRKGRRGIANATITFREPAGSGSSSTQPAVKVAVPKIRILPVYPTLQSFATTTSMLVTDDIRPTIRSEFARGWSEGIKQVRAIRSRLRTSWNNGMRIMQIEDLDHTADGTTIEEEGMDGLEDLSRTEAEWAADDKTYECPVFCLAGPGRGRDHLPGCGHVVGWTVWDDEM